MNDTFVVGNRDRCRRCQTKHGGNDHTCRVHGRVSEGCCKTSCDPADWVYLLGGHGLVERKNVDLNGWKRENWVWGPGVEVYSLKKVSK